MMRGTAPMLVGLLLAAACARAAEDRDSATFTVGRLFFTPEQRSVLNRQRERGLPAAMPSASEPLRLDGIVLRSDGYRALWINGRLQDAKDALPVKTDARHPRRAFIRNGAHIVPLRVGETLRQTTGTESTAAGNDADSAPTQ